MYLPAKEEPANTSNVDTVLSRNVVEAPFYYYSFNKDNLDSIYNIYSLLLHRFFPVDEDRHRTISYTGSLLLELSSAPLAEARGINGEVRFRYPCSEGWCMVKGVRVPSASTPSSTFTRQIASRVPSLLPEPDVKLMTNHR